MTDTLTHPTITTLPADDIRPGNNDRTRFGAQTEAAVEQLGLFAEQVTAATQRRDDAIVAMKQQGMTLRAIGAATGMSHAGVARVLARQ